MQQPKVDSLEDRVRIITGHTIIPIPYAAAFKVAQGLRLASRRAMRMTGEDVSKWRGYAEINDLPDPGKINGVQRFNTLTKFDWRIDVKDFDERVYLWFGNVCIILHFELTLKLATSVRHYANIAKHWAGDASKHRSMMGNLSDAERNYKYGWG